MKLNIIVNHIDFKFDTRPATIPKKTKLSELDERIELNPSTKNSNAEDQKNRGAVFESGNLQKQNIQPNQMENNNFKLTSKLNLFIPPKNPKPNYNMGFNADGNISGLGQSVLSSTIKGNSIQLNKRNHQQFQSHYYTDKAFVNDTNSDYSLSKFNPQENKFGPGKINNNNITNISVTNEPKYNSHHSNTNKKKDYQKKNVRLSGGLRLYKKHQSLIRRNRMTIEMGLYFQADREKEKYIYKAIKEMKTNFLKLGIRIDKASIIQNNDKRILFDDSLGNNMFSSVNKSNCSKSMSILDGSDSYISAKIFDDTFYNKYLLNNDSFNNILHNTFLHKLKNEATFNLFKRYLDTMEEMKTWMFQEFEEGKGYSNAEQFMKYFNLQVPINQHYFSGLSTKDKIKLICFFFCKFFNRNILMTQFGDVWNDIKIHHNYKTHSKM